MSINVNTASVLELMQIPGVGEKIATLIVELRSSYGYVTKEVLHLALRGKMTSEVLAMLDFSEPKPTPRNLMDFEGWSMHEDLNAMAAALSSCPVRHNCVYEYKTISITHTVVMDNHDCPNNVLVGEPAVQ
ncbi:hypothetical protein DPMN_096850 [Dreissena polymorpha]|uniref:Uncharacterized protein n=1 Tax=Dreissena polymorpha TaxID=45954 RepID=A0A9D4LAK8_DREPO|nr:hypothetical protein DPMN_096850 [Dreissena polymorpha]